MTINVDNDANPTVTVWDGKGLKSFLFASEKYDIYLISKHIGKKSGGALQLRW
jgi:bifunctional pyridoxal-dependent enzyme with beta-cystathionase and maltose regulon repressor activities